MLAPLGAWIAANAPLLEGIAAVASTAGAGIGVAESISQRNAAAQAYQQQLQAQQQAQQQSQQQQAAANAQAQAQQKAAISRQAPNMQEQLGGSVAPDYYAQQLATETGAAGQSNVGMDAFRQFLGDRNLQLDPAQGGLTTTASAGGSYWDQLQQGQQGADQVSGGLT